MNEVKFTECSDIEKYNLSSKDENTIYFIKTTKQIFKGSVEYVIPDAMSSSRENVLTGLGSIDGTNGTIKAKLPSEDKEVANKEYVDTCISAIDSMRFKGTIGEGGTITALPETFRNGDTYRIITAGTYADFKCEIGDLIIAISDSDEENASWTVAQANIDGAVIGTDVSVNENIVVFDGVSGKNIKDSSVSINNVKTAIQNSHTHSNKAKLDTYTKTESEILQLIEDAKPKWEIL